MDHLIGLFHGTVYAAISLVFIFIAKLIADKLTPYDDDHEIEENSNISMGFRRAGLYVGMAIAMAGALGGNGANGSFLKDIGLLAIDGLIIIPLIFIGRYVNDVFIIGTTKNDEAVRSGNIAVGLAEFGTFIATGLVINGSLSGEGRSLWLDVQSTVAFFVLGQVIFVALTKLYQKSKHYDVVSEISSGNASAGVALAGMLIALGFIMRTSIAGSFTGWMSDIASFAASAAMGIMIILILRKIIDFLFLPNTTQEIEIKRDKNVAALVLTESLVVGLAIIVSTII